MKKRIAPDAPELSRPLAIDKISAGGITEQIIARPEERKALCERFNLVDLPMLQADLSVDHVRGGMLAVKGTLEADVVQSCVVSLEPVQSHIKAEIDILFAPAGILEPGEIGTTRNDIGEEDVPEPIENGLIDLGEVTAQQLAVSLNPYPRLPDAVLPKGLNNDEKGEETSTNPFVQLKKITPIVKK